ncbi:MAG: phosphopyruvate hydratase [Candidatus Komeilibacteria bacterium]|nr:phosphopyruvate hydratase [Candidatus Komeilibacteria bacterium]
MDTSIQKITALEILDSRGNPTIQTTVHLANGVTGTAAVPSGASTGEFEAYELRDGDPKRYEGKGVLKAVGNVIQRIAPEIHGLDVTDQRRIDDCMIQLDGTDNKSSLGANAIVGVSLAVACAAAAATGLPLYRYLRKLSGMSSDQFLFPVPLINVINGGKHASTNLDLQEFWIIPHRAGRFVERVRQGSEIFQRLGELLVEQGMDTDLGNEGGYAPNFRNHEQVVKLLLQAIERAGYAAGDAISLGLDAGSSVLYDKEREVYSLALEDAEYSSGDMSDYFIRMFDRYPFAAAEDVLAEEDWIAWQKMTARLAETNPALKLIGDDLFVTNTARLQKGVDLKCANSILIKPNQVGTLTETLECIALAQKNRYAIAISHRSGETPDSFIADLAIAVNAEYIKTGSTARGERTAKYNRLIEIEQEIHGND